MAGTFINKYTDAAAYAADSSARATLGKSTVSMEADTRTLHYDGVNVAVKRPKQGDAVYVPTTSVYSDGSSAFQSSGESNTRRARPPSSNSPPSN